MPPRPAFRDLVRLPVTTSIALAASAVSAAWWTGWNIWPLAPGPQHPDAEPWHLLTSVLPHVGPLHLVFNVYWLITLGARLERAWGPWTYLGTVALLGVLSSATERLVASDTGVGLSGVIFGFVTLLHALRNVAGFEGAMDRRMLHFFGLWFVLCIGLTVTGMFPVANAGHAGGAAAGFMLGRCIAGPRPRRAPWIGACIAASALLVAGALAGVSWQRLLPADNGVLGYQALMEGRDADAVTLLEAAVKDDPEQPVLWSNLGVAYHRAGRLPEARAAYERALELGERDPALVQAVVDMLLHEAHTGIAAGDLAGAKPLISRALRHHPEEPHAHRLLGSVLAQQGDHDSAVASYERSRRYTPDEERSTARWREEFARELAIIEMHAGRDERAAELLLDALGASPGSGPLWILLGDAHARLGRLEEAMAAYGRAAEIDGYGAEAREAMNRLVSPVYDGP